MPSSFKADNTYISPLVLDINGDGISLSPLKNSHVFFDLMGNDLARQTGWINPGDGFLAVDLNRNGNIDDITELFGNDKTDGFTELSAYDSNQDGVITPTDNAFSKLRVWRDDDRDAVVDKDELQTLNALGITKIDAIGTRTHYQIEGHYISHKGSFIINGQSQLIVDVWLENNPSFTRYTGDTQANKNALDLPEFNQYGTLRPLSVAMTEDASLLKTVQNFTDTYGNSLDVSAAFQTDFKDMLFQWAGVENINPITRASANGQYLGFLEQYTNLPHTYNFNSTAFADPHNAIKGDALNATFERLYRELAVRFMAQSSPDLRKSLVYNPFAERVDLRTRDIETLTFNAPTNTTAQEAGYWLFLHAAHPKDVLLHQNILNKIVGLKDHISTDMEHFFRLNTTRDALGSIEIGSDSDDNFPMTGTGNDIYIGLRGNDNINGSSSDNNLYIGGPGDDTMIGRRLDDTFIFNIGDGRDLITDYGGYDRLFFGAGITANDVSYVWKAPHMLQITIGSAGDEIIINNFNAYHPTSLFQHQIEEFVFDDGTIHTAEHVMFQQIAEHYNEVGNNSIQCPEDARGINDLTTLSILVIFPIIILIILLRGLCLKGSKGT